jgi:hypothetical protein
LVSKPSLFDTSIISMQDSIDTTLVFGGDASLDHVVSHHVQPTIVPMQSSANITHVLRSDASIDHVVLHPFQPAVEEVVVSMQSSVDTTLLLESDKSKEVTLSMQYSINPTLLLGGDASLDHVLSISIFVPPEQGGIPLSSSMLPPSPRAVSFDWNDLVDPRLPSSTPFHIWGILQCIVDKFSSSSILSSSTWKVLGSPKIVSTTNVYLDSDGSPAWNPWLPP